VTRAPDAGFTLIETLIALAILAMTAVAMLGATEAHIARISGLEYRAAAQWAAENYLVELTLGLEPEAPAPMLGMQFDLQVEQTPTEDPDLQRVDITATDTADGRSYARLVGFVLTEAPP
jgi:general secretion pathway protein I